MNLHRKLVYIILVILSSNEKNSLHGSPTEVNITNTHLTGQDLIRMGNMMNKPLLSLLGATIVKTEQNLNKEVTERIGAKEKKLQNGIDTLTLDASKKLEVAEKKLQEGIDKIELDASKERDIFRIELCKQTRCAGWTEWSDCSAKWNGTFGAKTRSRKCGGSSTICSSKSKETVETDYQICQGKTSCKHTLTNNNYCITLYNSVKKTQSDAKADCHKDGGHLMNIDSELKVNDIVDFFKNISFISDVWIDGRRTLPNGDWKYEYGSKDSTFSLWNSSGNEPDSNDDCKAFSIYASKWEWWGKYCANTYYYLCELI